MLNDVQSIEKSITLLLDEKRIRLNDFFVDWDPLRSGFVTKQQFLQCFDLACQGNHGLRITQTDIEKLVAKYLNNSKGMVCYREFLNTVNKNFHPELMHPKPPVESQILAKVPYLKSIKSEIPTDSSKSKLVDNYIQSFYFVPPLANLVTK